MLKLRLCLSLLGIILLASRMATAQTLKDSTDASIVGDAEARRIFDLPGNTSIDPDETLEYLDELSALNAKGLELLHASADVSWTEARRELRTKHSTPFTSTDSSSDFVLRSRASSPLDPQAQPAYANNLYLGGPTAFYNRMIAHSSVLEVSALEQKQSGEASFTDHLTGFAELRSSVPIVGPISLEKVVVGDYALAFGNGLIFGGGLASAKGLHAASGVEERSFGLRGTVNGTAKDLRGGTIAFGIGPSRIVLFASDRSFDANVTNDTIRTIYSGTYHRTQAELATENAASAQVIGARAEIATADTANLYFKGGATAFELRYDHPYVGTTVAPFTGSQLSMAGVDALAISGAWTALAEAAHSSNDSSHKTALLLSTVFEPANHVAFSLNYRHVPNGYLSPFGEVSGTSASSLSNFDGYYFGIELVPIPDRLTVNAYSEFENELVPIGDLFGKQKYDYFATASYRATDALELKATARDQENASYVSDTGSVILQGQTLNLRLEAAYDPGTGAAFRTRFEHIHYSLTTSEDGWQASEEVRVKVPNARSEFTVTATRFETPSTKSAITSYEPGSPGAAAINLLDGLGWRVALRGSVKPFKQFALSAYLAGTVYDVPRTLGSGVTARIGTSDFSGTIQIDVNL